MFGNIFFLIGLVVSVGIGFIYFRDLGDLSQMVLKVKRQNMHRFIRHEYKFLTVGSGGFALMILAHFALDGGNGWLFWVAALLNVTFYGFPLLWLKVALRNQAHSAKYYSTEEARDFINPSADVIVVENNGVARAHPDNQLLRPHLAGSNESLNGEDVTMTY